MIGVILLVQICMAPPAGGVLLQGCTTRTVEAADCGWALGMVEALLAPDRVAIAGGCVTVIPPSRQSADVSVRPERRR